MNKKELKAKINEFVKKHKKVIVLTGVTVGGIVVCAIAGKGAAKKVKTVIDNSVSNWETLREQRKTQLAPDWKTGTLTEISGAIDGATDYELIVNDIKPTDLGKVGEDLLRLANVTDETQVSTLMYVIKPEQK